MPYLLKLACSFLLIVIITGCVEQTATHESTGEVAETTPSNAGEVLFAEQRFAEAGDTFLQLSVTAEPPRHQHFKLRAADAFVELGDLARARTIAQATDVSNLPVELRLHKFIILSETEISLGAPSLVPQMLPDSTLPESAGLRLRYHLVRARAFDHLEQPLRAARERVRADALIGDSARESNQRFLWDNLRKPSPAELGLAQADADNIFAGWAGLSLIARRHLFDSAAFENAIVEWSAQYPDHPALQIIIPQLKEASLLEIARPKHIALLLPLEGQFANASAVVRDGFMSAWDRDKLDPLRPKVSVWNTEGQDVVAVYQQARSTGADFIVGPLDKEAVTTLAESGKVDVPMLTLNQVQTVETSASTDSEESTASEETHNEDEPIPAIAMTSGGLFQFTLSPEGEAETVADRAWADGHGRAAVLVPQGEWGERVAEAFATRWVDLGGELAVSQAYDNQARDMSEFVTALLAVDQSRERWRTLQNAMGLKLEHEPRRRQDMDFIFMAAFPRQARQLRPTLMFHHASDVPVYSTSHLYTGIPNPQQDIDLESVVFGDMPWIVSPDERTKSIRLDAESKWGDGAFRFTRLYAFGIDAYSVVAELNDLFKDPSLEFHGTTGMLSIESNGVMVRKLVWAQFVGGLPVLLDEELSEASVE